jgi:hypothetical protein
MKALAAVLLLAACGPHVAPVTGPPVAPSADGGWKTLRAEHRVALDVTLDGGRHDRRTLRGIIAVERPDRFRLRALGPGGITLFDVLAVKGEVKVLQSIKDPNASALGGVVQAMAGDLQAAFLLEPTPPGRTVRTAGSDVIIEEPDRTVKLSQFRAVDDKTVATRIGIDNRAHHYAVGVDATGVEVDRPLDPALWKE